jgi:hypothetical protein
VALRLGMFVPETFERYGFRLLFGGVDDHDVASCVVRALQHRPRERLRRFDMADSGLTRDDLPRLYSDPADVLEERRPGTTALVHDWGLTCRACSGAVASTRSSTRAPCSAAGAVRLRRVPRRSAT